MKGIRIRRSLHVSGELQAIVFVLSTLSYLGYSTQERVLRTVGAYLGFTVTRA